MAKTQDTKTQVEVLIVMVAWEVKQTIIRNAIAKHRGIFPF